MKRIVSLICALCLVLLLVPARAEAAEITKSGTCGDNLTWTLDDKGTLTISGTGNMWNYSSSTAIPWYYFCSSISSVVIEDGVTSICDSAFNGCKNAISITIPESVTSIGRYAFHECYSLTGITLPNGISRISKSTFSACSKLTSIIIPDGVTSIGDYAIDRCSSLTTIRIPDTVTSIGNYAFMRCEKLTGITLPEGLTSIGNSAFNRCSELTSIDIPDTVTSIGEGAFYHCTGLKNVSLSNNISAIHRKTFHGCSSLTSVIIPEGITSIGELAFLSCRSLTSVWFMGDAPDIYYDAFVGVTANAYYSAGNPSWTEDVLQGYGGEITWIPIDPFPDVLRLSGSNRYETGFAIADQLKKTLDLVHFNTVIVAYGQNFPDALTGSYLAAVKNAPILLTEVSQDANVLAYLEENLVSGGKVYILGGTSAVSRAFEDEARNRGYDVKRLKGADRYETNLAILAEAGVNTTDEILIATGKNYADSLSASATGLPMLLVDKTLTEDQKAFLENTSKNFVILGGTSAVSAEIEAELAEIGTVTRVKGSNRYETSVEIAKRYFENPQAVVLAYSHGFPDGLCGGPLALSMGAPLILTSDDAYGIADDYVDGISSGVVTGGTGRISDDTVREIFDLPDDAQIVKP